MGDLGRDAGLLALGMARCLPLAWLVPALGGRWIPLRMRLAVGGALLGLCLPIVLTHAPTHAPDIVGGVWALLLLRELLVGVVMGFVCSCWFRAAEAAGGMIDVLSGVDIRAGAEVGGGNHGAIGELMLLLAIVVFLEIGGVGHVALALARSYEAIPISASVSVEQSRAGAAAAAIVASGKLIEAGLGLSAPVVVALLLSDLLLGLIGRAAPQIAAHVVGMPLKTLLAIGVLLLGLGAIRTAMQASLADFLVLMRPPMGLGR